ADWAAQGSGAADAVSDAERRVQCELIREIFGSPFRPIAPDPPWRTSTVETLARRIRDEKDFAALPILADALQDAGSDTAALLPPCRSRGAHVRGCWAVDLLLNQAPQPRTPPLRAMLPELQAASRAAVSSVVEWAFSSRRGPLPGSVERVPLTEEDL